MEIDVALHQSYPHPQGAVVVGVVMELALLPSIYVLQEPADVLPHVVPLG